MSKTNKTDKLKKIWSSKDDLSKFSENYNYQEELTKQLDNLGNKEVDEKTLLEIILWKVNRYPDIKKINFNEINKIADLKYDNFRESSDLIESLLGTKGFGIAMVSTLLRFRNPNVFPIIDKRAYRVLMDNNKLPIYSSTKPDQQIEIYFEYVEAAHKFAKENDIEFQKIDRILYNFDKVGNKEISIS